MASNENTTSATPTNLNETRTGIQKVVEPLIDEAMLKTGLNMNDPVILRRYFRALITVGCKRLLDAGAPPRALVAQAVEAIHHELEAREAAGTAQTAKAGDPSVEN